MDCTLRSSQSSTHLCCRHLSNGLQYITKQPSHLPQCRTINRSPRLQLFPIEVNNKMQRNANFSQICQFVSINNYSETAISQDKTLQSLPTTVGMYSTLKLLWPISVTVGISSLPFGPVQRQSNFSYLVRNGEAYRSREKCRLQLWHIERNAKR